MSAITQPSIEQLRQDLDELLVTSHKRVSLSDIAYQLFLQASDDSNAASHEQVKAQISALNDRINAALTTVGTEYQQLLDDSIATLASIGEPL